jgi:hypothetical protein
MTLDGSAMKVSIATVTTDVGTPDPWWLWSWGEPQDR